MVAIQSFPPIAGKNARVLILGSIPGEASLQAGEYYAHPHNQFWPILSGILGCELPINYSSKIEMLMKHRIALWDVMQSCYRPGSLDASIAKGSIIANDFISFLKQHPQITDIFFNGSAAQQAFQKLVLPGLSCQSLSFHRLPSTSPAHAALSYQQKRESWSIIAYVLQQQK